MFSIASYLVALLVVSLCFSLPAWKFIDEATSQRASRVNTIDGIRGYLALSVMLHHAVIARTWLATGNWTLPADPFFAQLGSVAVSLFFMITGYLFWGKLVARQGHIDWAALYIGRVFRIGPVYWIAVTGMVATVFWRTGFELREPIGSLVNSVVHWYGFGFLIGHDFNGYRNVWIILAGVVWTLKYEWRFYLALFPASFLARRRLHLPAAFVLLGIAFARTIAVKSDSSEYWILFAVGAVCASLREAGIKPIPRDSVASTISAAVLIGLFIVHPAPYSVGQALALAIVFVLICNGATFFGLLTSNAATRLGHASYGIYLLQGFVFSIGFDNSVIKPLVTTNIAAFWAVTLAGMLALCTTSALIYAGFESPMIERGRRLGKRASQAIAESLGKRGEVRGEAHEKV
ncbi:acyltransferase [Paraburkholderia sp.]|uniref:acyltransferase family protein n=1 Tax=Paraburkholderia sp. TaxID=1926495 RepID=UPI0025F54214|nr:acyltransferase [Paraburkholderia sp.]